MIVVICTRETQDFTIKFEACSGRSLPAAMRRSHTALFCTYIARRSGQSWRSSLAEAEDEEEEGAASPSFLHPQNMFSPSFLASKVARWQKLIPAFPCIVPGWRGTIQGKEWIKFCSGAIVLQARRAKHLQSKDLAFNLKTWL